jgi:hypothetical protein
MPSESNRLNFYENQNEASIRLRRTVVMYDDEPYYVIGISDHKNDGKLRIYLDKMGYDGIGRNRDPAIPSYHDFHPNELGPILDSWIEANPTKGIVRKFLGAAGFNKFRPFPLGNMNMDGQVVYVERTPTRNTFQGLRSEAVVGQLVSVAPNRDKPNSKKMYGGMSTYGLGNIVPVEMFTSPFYDCIMGNYPTFDQVIEGLRDPDVINTGVAFHREFSVLRGPIGMMVLCYHTEGVGLISGKSSNQLTLGKEFAHLKETLEELNIFNTITIQE